MLQTALRTLSKRTISAICYQAHSGRRLLMNTLLGLQWEGT